MFVFSILTLGQYSLTMFDFGYGPVPSDGPYGVCHGDETFLQFLPLNLDDIPVNALNEADARD